MTGYPKPKQEQEHPEFQKKMDGAGRGGGAGDWKERETPNEGEGGTEGNTCTAPGLHFYQLNLWNLVYFQGGRDTVA